MSDRYLNYLRSVLNTTSSTSSESTNGSNGSNGKDKASRKRQQSANEKTEDTISAPPVKARRQSPVVRNDLVEDPLEGTSRGPAARPMAQQGLSLENDPKKRDKIGNPYAQGITVFSDNNVDINIRSVEHQRQTRFRTEDHLYQINIIPRRRTAPLIISLENAIAEALSAILSTLQGVYARNLHHQVYITVIERNILHGLNTGNFDLNTPPREIINRVLTILHSYLKSKQTLQLNDSFKIQLKVLSHNHSNHAAANNPAFRKKFYKNYSKIRN